MDLYKKIIKWIDYLNSLIASIGAVYIKEYLENNISGQKTLVILITFSIALLIFITLTYTLREFVKRNILLKRLILGSNYIGGIWFDYVKNMDGLIVGGGIISIKINSHGIEISGDNYNMGNGKCEKVGDFQSALSKFNNRRLDFSYYSNNRNEGTDAPGFARYKFPDTNSRPEMFESYFFSGDNKEKFSGIAERITDKETIIKLRKGHYEQRAEIICQFLKSKTEK